MGSSSLWLMLLRRIGKGQAQMVLTMVVVGHQNKMTWKMMMTGQDGRAVIKQQREQPSGMSDRN